MVFYHSAWKVTSHHRCCTEAVTTYLGLRRGDSFKRIILLIALDN